MDRKILMNKNTLAALKLELKEYNSALPVFEMKEQQLKQVVQAVEESILRLRQEIKQVAMETKKWAAVLADREVDPSNLVELEQVITKPREIAGARITEFVEIKFGDKDFDLFLTPLWVDTATDMLADQKTRQIMLDLERKKLDVLQEELYEARRMKNALKEVFIPETIENIRKIEIYLGDVERLAIGCAKLVKKKKTEKKMTV
ncbi:MAG: hypothetical protein HKN87_00570 [Saprospiraceae bacterium]|nr:hypothetical protein [Saprospiraceae bacterium]